MPIDVKLFDDLDAVAVDAAGALDRERQPNLFDRLSWYRLLAEHDPQARPRIARARDGTAAAWLFLSGEVEALRGLTNWYSLTYAPAHTGSEENRQSLLVSMAIGLRNEASRVELGPLGETSPLPAAFQTAGWIVDVRPVTWNWDIETSGLDFESYWGARPGQLRSTAKRKAKAAGLDIALHTAFEESAWADYEAVYRHSWKPEEGSPAMLRALAESEGAAGTLRVGIAKKDGRPVAAQLWLVENGEATIHKLAYAEDMKALSPGTILSVEMFRRAIDVDRVRRIDFGTGDDPYKRDWMERRTTLYRMIAYNPARLAGLAGAARAKASALVRSLRSR